MNRRIAGTALAAIVSLALPVLASCGNEFGDPVAVADTPAGAALEGSVASVPASSPATVASTEAAPPAVSTTGQPATEETIADQLAEQASEPPAAVPAAADVTEATEAADPVPVVDEISPYLSAFCPTTPQAVAVDRERQSAWLCEDGRAVYEFPFTGAITQPDPGTYPVYAKDLDAFSTLSGSTSFMTHFVAFTYGKYQGARVAFHSVPTHRDGTFVQPLESVGDVAIRGQSAGCLRVLPDHAVKVWDWLALGDEVRIIN